MADHVAKASLRGGIALVDGLNRHREPQSGVAIFFSHTGRLPRRLCLLAMTESYTQYAFLSTRAMLTRDDDFYMDSRLRGNDTLGTEMTLGLCTNKCVNSKIGYINNNIIYEG